MNIAVIDVAAEKSGALTVLNDFVEYLDSNDDLCEHNMWYIYTSIPIKTKHKNIINILVPEAKKGRIRRLIWDRITAITEFKQKKIDAVVSLQNAAFRRGDYRQLVYFHNVLLLDNKAKYSLLNKKERSLAIYTKIISKYTLHSLKNADYIFVQTETVKKKIESFNNTIPTFVVRPNIKIPLELKNSARLPLRSIIYPTAPSEYKRIEDIIQCVKTYKKWFADNDIKVYLTIKGTETQYAKDIYELGKELEKVIVFLGRVPRDDLLNLYKNSVLLQSSSRESFPMPFLEAAYVGAPIVAARYDYSIDCLSNFNNVFLYEPGSCTSLFECIQRAFSIESLKPNNFDISDNTWRIMLDKMMELK